MIPGRSDDDLLDGAKAGDEAAFRELCDRYTAGLERRLRGAIRGKLRRRVSVADVMQEVLIVAHKRLGDFDPEGAGAFGRWLDAIATRRVKHAQRFHLGAARRDARGEITRPAMTRPPDPPSKQASASGVAVGRELSDAVRKAIQMLPQDQQDVLRLLQRGDMTLQQVADLTGKTRDAVKGLQSRALKRLAQILGMNGGTSLSSEDRLAEILAEWTERRAAGDIEDPASVIERHPDLADDLRARFRTLQLLEFVGAAAAPEPDDVAARVPRQIGEYRIVRELGRGGMGVVYEAEQVALNRRVALKVLFPSITRPINTIRRFKREARAAAKLNHTNILSIHALGEDQGTWYYAMDLVEGTSLDQILSLAEAMKSGASLPATTPVEQRAVTASRLLDTEASDRVRYARIAEMFAGLADALHVAHQAGIVHRDVKPANLLLDQDGALHITDFGVARLMADTAESMTRTGDIVGTPTYMSPEQARAATGSIDARTDVYSLGATLYEVVTLSPPFEATDVVELYRMIIHQEPRSPAALDPSVPRDLETIIQKSMQKEREDRYASAREMARDLRAFAEDRPINARRTPLLRRAWKAVKRQPVLAGVASAALVACAAALVFWGQASDESARRVELEYDQLLDLANEAYLARGEDPGAIFERAIAASPDRPEAYVLRAHLAQRSTDDRISDIDHAVERGLPAFDGHEHRGMILREAGRGLAAFEEFERAIAMSDGEHPSIGAVFKAASAGQSDRALALLDRIVETHSSKSVVGRGVRMTRLRIRESREDYEGALVDASALVEAAPPHLRPACEMSIIRLWYRMGREEQADLAYEALLKRLASAPSAAWSPFIGECPGYGEFRSRALDVAEKRFSGELWYVKERIRGALPQDPESGLKYARQAFALAPDDVEVRYHLGSAIQLSGDTAEARRQFEGALELDPAHAQTIEMLGDILLSEGDTKGALVIADRALATPHISAPDSPLRLKARALGMRGEYGAALEANAAAIELRPEDIRHFMDRAILLMNAGRLEAALDALQTLEASDAFRAQGGMLQKPGVHRHRSNILGALGRFNEALAEMELAIEAAGGDAAGLGASYGTLLNNVGQFDKAVDVMLTHLETQPNDWYGWYVLGFAHAALRQSDDALAALDRSVALRGGQVDVSVLASRVRVRIFQTGQYRMALPDLDMMIARAPDYAPSYYYRAFAHAGLRELADAREALELAESRFPDHSLRPAGTAGYAEALRMRGFAGKALAKLREARPLFLRQDYELENWRMITGTVMWAAGRPDEALALFRAAAEASPTNPYIRAIWLSHASFLEPEERVEDVQAFVAEPPVSPVPGALGKRLNDDILACVLDMALHVGQAEGAVQVIRARVESPAGPVLAALVSALRALGRDDEAKALAAASLDPDPEFDDRLDMAHVAAVAGNEPIARKLLESARESWEAADAFRRAQVHIALGELDAGIEWYEKALDAGFPPRDRGVSEIPRLRAHPKWPRLSEKYGMMSK